MQKNLCGKRIELTWNTAEKVTWTSRETDFDFICHSAICFGQILSWFKLTEQHWFQQSYILLKHLRNIIYNIFSWPDYLLFILISLSYFYCGRKAPESTTWPNCLQVLMPKDLFQFCKKPEKLLLCQMNFYWKKWYTGTNYANAIRDTHEQNKLLKGIFLCCLQFQSKYLFKQVPYASYLSGRERENWRARQWEGKCLVHSP